MKTPILLLVAALAACMFCVPAFSQDVTLPAAPDAAAPTVAPAADAPQAVGGDLLMKIKVRRDARKIALQYVRDHRGATESEVEAAVIDGIKANAAAGDYGTLADDKDWSAFFEALADFLERILPLIMELIDAFSV